MEEVKNYGHGEMREVILFIRNLFAKLPHSESRAPYTYHHDYVRTHVPSCYQMGRGEIAALQNWTELELWSTALMQLCTELGIKVFAYIDAKNLNTIQECYEITQHYISNF